MLRVKKSETVEVEQEKKSLKKDYLFSVGRRKSSVARIRLYVNYKNSLKIGEQTIQKGEIFANGRKIEEHFKDKVAQAIYSEPFKITNTLGKYTITAKLEGGGYRGQLEAFVLGVSKILASIDLKNRQILKKKGFLTRDARVRERRKVGMGGKARRVKQSPKR